MFDFEKLSVYQKAKNLNKLVVEFLFVNTVDKTTHDQLRRASFSIMLNIAEGTGRLTKPDKRHFYVIARGSTFEVAAIIDYLKDLKLISNSDFDNLYQKLEEISKMLFGLINQLKPVK